jgi:hypothetical protein
MHAFFSYLRSGRGQLLTVGEASLKFRSIPRERGLLSGGLGVKNLEAPATKPNSWPVLQEIEATL